MPDPRAPLDRDRLRRALAGGGTSPTELLAICGGDHALAARLVALTERSGARNGDDALPAESLGEFRLIALLGAGGMGRVYLAEQTTLANRLVALKVLAAGSGADARQRLRFRREAEIAATLDHSSIVPVYAVGEEGGLIWLAMRWLTGPSLADVELPLPPRRVAEIGVAVARALDEAHLAGVVHRDVKPANVLLDDGRPVLVDFGLARGLLDVKVTSAGFVPGTLAYLAPEQLRRGGSVVDPRLDVYSLGATLYELLAGRPPHPAPDAATLVNDILTRDPPPLRLPGAHRDLETIVLRCVEHDPERRFESCAELAGDLERYLDGRPIGSRRVGAAGRVLRFVARHRRTAAAVATLLVVAAALGSVLLASRVKARAAYAAQIAEAGAATERGNLVQASAILDALRASPFRGGEWERERDLLGRCRDLELLLETLMHPYQVSPPFLADVERAVTDGALPADRERVRRLACSLARFVLGDAGGARRGLARVPGAGLDVDALSALIDDRADWRPPASASAASPDEHVVAFIALREMGAPLDVLEREVRAALERDPSSRRARYALCMLKMACAEADPLGPVSFEDAIDELRVFVADADPGPAVRRALATMLMLTGATAAAEEQLHLLEAEHPELWQPSDEHLRLTARLTASDSAAREAMLATIRGGAWGGDPQMLLLEASLCDSLARPSEAQAALDRARGAGTFPRQRQLVEARCLLHEASELRARFRRLAEAGSPDAAEADACAREAGRIHAAALAAADGFIERQSRAQARLAAALALADAPGGASGALDDLEAAMSLDRADALAPQLYRWIVVGAATDLERERYESLAPEERASPAAVLDLHADERMRTWCRRALEHGARGRELAERFPLSASLERRDPAAQLVEDALLARACGDYAASLERIDAAARALDDGGDAGLRAEIGRYRELLAAAPK